MLGQVIFHNIHVSGLEIPEVCFRGGLAPEIFYAHLTLGNAANGPLLECPGAQSVIVGLEKACQEDRS